MARDVFINGEAMIRVRFGNHISAGTSNIVGSTTNLSELGLAQNEIRITPRFVHMDVKADDFGPEIPAEILWHLSDATVRMTLIHYDPTVLSTCLSESMAGGGFLTGNEGQMAPAGTPMGGFLSYLTSGYHYVSLNILSPVAGVPWRFPSAYLAEQPIVYPLGTKRSLVELNWRAVPFAVSPTGEISSSGATLWDHQSQL